MIAALCLIAILDTGVLCEGLPCVKGYNNTDIVNDHGTRVAWTAHRTAPACKILPVKVYDRKLTEPKLYKALRYTLRNVRKGDAVNLSMHLRFMSKRVKRVVQRLHRRGVYVVAAAGNGGASRIREAGALTVGTFEDYSGPAPIKVLVGEWGTSFAAPVVSAILARVK